VLVAADIVCFVLTSLLLVAPHGGRQGSGAVASVTAAADPAAGPLVPVADLGIPGRFAVYDPDLLAGNRMQRVGAPDANLLVGGYSLQGYSAIVDGIYADATGSHGALGAGQDVLSVSAIADGTLDQLDPGALVTPPQYVVVDASRAAVLTASGAGYGPDPAAGRRRLVAGSPAQWTFGESVDLTAVQLPVAPSGDGVVQLGVVETSGSVDWLPPQLVGPKQRGSAAPPLTAVLTQPVRAVGLEVRTSVAGSTGVPVVSTSSGVTLDLDGMLQAALTGGQWRYFGADGPFAVYAATHPVAPLTLRARPGATLAGATVRRDEGAELAPASAYVDSPAGVVVVRSVAAIDGWSATWEPSGGGAAQTLAVHRTGIVQAVTVPAGRGVLRWVYHAPGLRTSEILGAAGLAALIGLLLFGCRRKRLDVLHGEH